MAAAAAAEKHAAWRKKTDQATEQKEDMQQDKKTLVVEVEESLRIIGKILSDIFNTKEVANEAVFCLSEFSRLGRL